MTENVKPLVSIVALQVAADVVAAACASEDVTANKWLNAAKALHTAGLRYAMIGGKDQHKETRAELRAFIVSVLPAKKRDLLLVKGRDVVELTDAQKVQREMYSRSCNTYIGRIAAYLKRHEGIETTRKPKSTTATNTAVFVAPETREEMMVALNAINAKCNTIGLPARAAAQVADAMQVALAVLNSHKPKDAPKA